MKAIEPWKIRPPRDNPDAKRVREIADSFKKVGWKGRPLLVERLDAEGEAFQGWTGSHRIMAALQAREPEEVPVVELNIERLKPFLAGKLKSGETIYSFLVDDTRRLQMLRLAGDHGAAQLLQTEILMHKTEDSK